MPVEFKALAYRKVSWKQKGYLAGGVFIDDHNIQDLDLKCLRRNIGVVSQEPSLFAGNIRENIKVGKMDAGDEEIQRAATLANAHSFISQLPDQYSTHVTRPPNNHIISSKNRRPDYNTLKFINSLMHATGR